MNEINDLRDNLFNNPDKEKRLKAAGELTKMASKGNEEAAKILYEMLEKEEDPEVWIKPFEVPPKSKEDKRDRFVRTEYNELFIMPILKERNISEYQKTTIIKFAKSFIELYEANDYYGVVRGAMTILSYLTDEDDLFNFVDMLLKKDTTDIDDLLSSLKHWPGLLQRIISVLRGNPDEYSLKFVEIFDWLLRNPSPETVKIIKELWFNLPWNYKVAVKLYYYQRYAREFGGALPGPTEHPFLEWLEDFERGAVTTFSFASYIALHSASQMVAEKLGLHLKDVVREIETHEPSPLTRKNREPQREENRELIPIDKLLGEYFPDDQLIKLYMTEIYDCAKRLMVSVNALRRVVEFHESAHAVVHLGRDAEGRNFNTGAFKRVDGGVDPSPLHETLAQLLTYHCIKDFPELLECFEELNQHQPSAYRKWENFTHVPLERIRNILVGIRQGRIEASFDIFARIVI